MLCVWVCVCSSVALSSSEYRGYRANLSTGIALRDWGTVSSKDQQLPWELDLRLEFCLLLLLRSVDQAQLKLCSTVGIPVVLRVGSGTSNLGDGGYCALAWWDTVCRLDFVATRKLSVLYVFRS